MPKMTLVTGQKEEYIGDAMYWEKDKVMLISILVEAYVSKNRIVRSLETKFGAYTTYLKIGDFFMDPVFLKEEPIEGDSRVKRIWIADRSVGREVMIVGAKEDIEVSAPCTEEMLPFVKDLMWDQRTKLHNLDGVKDGLFRIPVLSKEEDWEKVLVKAHGAAEFQKFFKRTPKIEALWTIYDVQGFKFGEWKKAADAVDFQKLTEEQQEDVVAAFEVTQSNDPEVLLDEKWHSIDTKECRKLLRIRSSEKSKIVSTAKALLKQFEEDKEYLYPSFQNFGLLYNKHYQNIKNKNWDAIKKALDAITYQNVRPGAEELARYASKRKISEKQYRVYEEAYLKTLKKCLTAGREFPTISGENWEVLTMDSPRAWLVGEETYCCMTAGGLGWGCLGYAAKHPETSGVLRVFDEKGNTIAQSFLWLDDKIGHRTLVLDNIEVAGKELRKTVKKAYLEYAEKMEFYSELFGIVRITVGSGYSDIDLSDLCKGKVREAEIPADLSYSDASTQYLLKNFF